MSYPKKILYIDNARMYGGGQKHLLNLLDGINKNRYTPTVICSYENLKFIKELKNRNIEFISLKTKILIKGNKIINIFLRIPNFLSLLIKTAQIIRKRKINIVHANLFYSAIFGGIAAKILRRPFVWTVHIPEDLTKYKILTRFIINLSDKVTPTCNDFIGIAKENGFDVSKFETTYSGLKIEDYKTKVIKNKIKINNKEIEKPIVAMVARIDPEQKRQGDFIEAANIILKEINKVNFLIVGEASTPQEEKYQQKLESLINKKGLSSKVMFTGFFSDLNYLLANIEILVLPSLKESIPAIILEAMAMKKPVVASNVGGIPEVVVDGETGFLVPPKDPKAIAEKVIFLLKNPQIAKEMGEKGYQRVKENFNLEKMARAHEKLYEELLKNISKKR